MVIVLSGPQNGGGKGGLVGGVGEKLGLQTKGVTGGVHRPLFPTAARFQEISGVELETRQGGIHLEGDAAGRRTGPGPQWG